MTNDYIQHLLRFYAGVRELIQSLSLGTSAGKNRNSKSFDDVVALAASVAAGYLDIGSRVTGRGWLSSYAYWYLPNGYSPYSFRSDYAMSEDGTAGVRMNPSPAFLPAGRIPFERENLVLGFLYPTTTTGFTLKLANPTSVDIPTPEVDLQSPDDHPWIYDMDNGFANYSMNPERWTYSKGATHLFHKMPQNDSQPNLMLTDPARVREVVEVPTECKPIPILYPRGHCSSNRYVNFSAHLVELNSGIMSELSSLGRTARAEGILVVQSISYWFPRLLSFGERY